MAHPLVPLLILFIVVCVAAFVGYIVYTVANDVADKTSKKMEKHNVSFGKEGMRIGMKEVKNEDYAAQTQNVLVKVWNLSTWPAYKSRLWNKEQESGKSSGSKAASSSAKKR